MRRTESRESLASLASNVSRIGDYGVGERVEIEGRVGTIAFIGQTQFAAGEWIGLVLDEATGKNDGSLNGIRYFECEPQFGLFCKAGKLKRIISTPSAPISPYAAQFGFDVGDRVQVSGGKIGLLRFLDVTQFAKDIWAGVELDQPNGKNDGSVQGIRYFQCKPLYGIFAPAAKTELVDSKLLKSRHNKSSLLRYQQKRAGGSNESLNSIGASSLASSRIGVARRGFSQQRVVEPAGGALISLRKDLQEKEQHLEQLMKEKDMDLQEITKAENQIKEKNEKISELEFRFVEMEISLQDVTEKLAKVQEELEVTKANKSEQVARVDIAPTQTAPETNADFDKKLAEHAVAMKSLQSEITSLNQRLEAADQEKAKLAVCMEEAQQTISRLEAEKLEEAARLQKQLTDLQTAKESSAAVADSATQQKTKLSNELVTALNALKELQAAREKDGLESQSQLAASTASLEAEAAQRLQLDGELKKLVASLKEAEEKCAKIEAEKAGTLEKLEKSLREIETLKSSTSDVVSALNKDKDELVASMKEAEEKCAKIEAEKAGALEKLEKSLREIETSKSSTSDVVSALNKDKDELNGELLAAKKQLEELKNASEKEMETLRKELATTKASADSGAIERQAVGDDLRRTQEAREQLVERVSQLDAENRDLATKLDQHAVIMKSLQSEITLLNQHLAAADQEKAKLSACFEEAQQNISRLESEKLAESMRLQKQLIDLQAAGQSSAGVADAATQEKTRLSNELLTALNALKELQAAREKDGLESQSQLSAAKASLEAEAAQRLQLDGELKKLTTSLKEAEEKYTNIAAEKLAESTRLQKQLADLQAAGQSSAEVADSATQEKTKLSNELLAALNALKELQATHEKDGLESQSQLAASTASLEAEVAQRLQLDGELKKSVASLKEAEEKCAKIEAEKAGALEKLEKSLREIETSKSSTSDVVSALNKDKDELNGELLAAKKQLEELKGASQKEMEALRKELATTKASADSGATERQAVDDDLKRTQEAREQLVKRVSQLDAENRELVTKLEKAMVDYKELTARNGESESALASTAEEYRTLGEQMTTFTTAMDDLTERLMQMGLDREAALKEAEQQRTAAANVKAQIASEIEKLTASLNHEKSEKSALQARLSADEEKLAALSAELAKLGDSLKTVDTEKKAISVELDQVKKARDSFEDEAKRVQTENALLKESSAARGEQNSAATSAAMSQLAEYSAKNAGLQREIEALTQEKDRLLKVEQSIEQREKEAAVKFTLLCDMEADWERERAKLKNKIEELENKPAEAGGPTFSYAPTGNPDADFLNSIIADLQKKNVNLQKENGGLRELLGKYDVGDIISPKAKKQKAPRVYCDICDVFDAHEFEDCPTQTSMIAVDEMGGSGAWPGAYGHSQGTDCKPFASPKTPKSDYTF